MTRLAIAFLVAGAASSALADGVAPTPEAIEFFESKMRPLLAENCYRCHSGEAQNAGKLKAGLRLDSLAAMIKGGDSGPALKPGEPDGSLIVEAVRYRNEDMAMPPKRKLGDEQVAIFEEWVKMGSPWPGEDVNAALAAAGEGEEAYDWEKFRREHWSFKPFTKSEPPSVANDMWPRSPIDSFILAKLEHEGLRPNTPADKRTLIRRAYLDLIGLPPAPEKVDAFLRDASPGAFADVVDELLASKHYGERWARHWLDVARYSDGLGGFGDNQPLPEAWRYRDWVVNALNEDMPFDQFAARQIAGDVLENDPDPVGTGFFVVGPTYQSDGGDPEAKAQAEGETLYDRVDTFSRAFLGLTAACARCHDHKFDPITTKDYYSIAGIFRNSRKAEHPTVPQAEVDAYKQAQGRIKEQEKTINQFLDAESKRLEVPRKEVEKKLDEESKATITEMRSELDRLKQTAPPKYSIAHVLQDSGSGDMHIALRGDLRKKGDIAPRRFLQIVAGEDAKPYTHGSGRRELAQSVVARDNPLTARVIVNRVWGWHFGHGLVRTPSNFGILGEKPSHPELLDWLAAEFVEHGWSIKRLHRQILLTATWQQSSAHSDANFVRDGDNRLLWRMNPRKLEVEAWRDTLLAATGELDRQLGGKPAGEILGSTRRTIYATISRSGDRFQSDDFLRLFDFPAAASTAPKRAVSTVPQQYLFMMNSPFMTSRAKTLGQSLHDQSEEIPERIASAYQKLYSRPPDAAEVALGAAWLGDAPTPETWQQYAQVLLSAHELIQIR